MFKGFCRVTASCIILAQNPVCVLRSLLLTPSAAIAFVSRYQLVRFAPAVQRLGASRAAALSSLLQRKTVSPSLSPLPGSSLPYSPPRRAQPWGEAACAVGGWMSGQYVRGGVKKRLAPQTLDTGSRICNSQEGCGRKCRMLVAF